ncbi:MAG TPA: hypothetical protein VGN80_04100 [Devosiaceae bacterium]|nr:hypothetical protein [Devosiaceae bacterium]
MTGVSLLALALGMAAALPAAPARAQDARTVVNGNAGGGVILLDGAAASHLVSGGFTDASDGVLASGGHNADASDMTQITADGVINGATGSYVVSDKIFRNFVTEGGAGSGGGGGLGGVFFVDQGASLEVNNVDFRRNTAIGGVGGSDPAVDLGTVQIGLGDIDLPFLPISAYYFDPELASNGSGGYTVSTLTLTDATQGLRPGMRIILPGGEPVTITSISPDKKTLAFDSVTLDSSLFVDARSDLIRNSAQSDRDKLYFLGDVGLDDAPVKSILMIDGEQTDVRIESFKDNVVTLSRPLTDDEWATITAEDPFTGDPVYSFEFLNLTKADISQIKSVDTISNVISLPGENGFFKPGMVLTGGEFGDDSVTVTGVVYDATLGETLVTVDVSGGTLPSDLTSFDAALEQVEAGGNTLRVTNSRLFGGMTVSGAGVPDGTTIQSINADGTITLSNHLAPGVKPESLTFSGVSGVSGSEVTFVNDAMLAGVSEGMIVSGPGIPPGTTVDSIVGNTVTLSSAPSGDITSLTFASETSLGGSMNGIAQTATGSTGRDGNDGPWTNMIWGDGEGNDGRDGDDGSSGTVGAGGAGGRGGNGSSALQWSPEQIKAVVDAGVDAGFNVAEAAAALTSVPPDVGESVAATLQAAKAFVDLGFETGKLAEWYVKFANGDNAAGGVGGGGGWGGNGDDFFGGGVGGAGGDGGDAGNTAAGDGGNGGDGGRGGTGGFGGGGGMGGAGGMYGDGVSVATGVGGLGGEGGFGGGTGSSGDGWWGGEGGSGFGGAIFVRNGGELLITGNSVFEDNSTEGGSSTDGGQAGDAAGADLFMMKGSTVTIRPGTTAGVDNIVVFNGTIGDDSRESFDEAANGRGFGADLTIGKGLVIFNGRNTYTGQTIMEGGVLQADDGWGLNLYSNLNFNGGARTGTLSDNTNAGVLMTSGYFEREVGTSGPHVQWTGSGGFAAKGGELIVNLGDRPNPQTLNWGSTPGFFSTVPTEDAALVFGSEHADSVVRWINPINLGSLDRQIVVTDNGNGELDDFAVMEGAISGTGGLTVGEANSTFWDGTLVLTGQNSFTGDIGLRSGTLAIAGDGSLATGGVVDVDIADGATFQVMAEGLDLGIIDNAGVVTVGEDVKALGIDNTGAVLMMADIDLRSGFPFADNTFSNYNGDFYNGPGATLTVATNPASDPDDSAHRLTVDEFRGEGVVVLGTPVDPLTDSPQPGDDAPILTIAQRGASTFDGVIMGAGGLTLTSSTDPGVPTPPVPASKLTLTKQNTYFGSTIIDEGSTMALKDDGGIRLSKSVQVDGTFDIADVTTTAISPNAGTAGPTGTSINDLSGAASGEVVLGDNLLVVDNAASEFAGVISGTGDLAIKEGEQTLSGINTYTGETYVLPDATLKLLADGSIAESARVVVWGGFDISGTNNGASIKGLEGNVDTAKVTLGDERLTITGADTTAYPDGTSFAGVIAGSGGVSVTGGKQTLTNANTYTGETIIDSPAELDLVGDGGIANSTKVTVDGIFDISGTTAGAEIIELAGTDTTADIVLGSQTLTLTGDGDSRFAGVVTGDGSSGLSIEDGTLELTGASPGFLGKTTIEENATLFLRGDGSITGSTVDLSGVFDISGIITPNAIPDLTALGTSVHDLYGDGEIDLGDNTLAVSDATDGTFSGPITGTGAFGVSGGTLNLDLAGNPTLNASLFAATGGKIVLAGGSIDTTGSDQSALSVINGGIINVTDVKLKTGAAHPTASVLFDGSFDPADNPAHIVLGAGTVLENEGPLLVVDRTGAGSEAGNVNFIIDNASVVFGDILDEDATRGAGMGGTTVYLGEGVDWTGMTVAADFLVKAGAAAHFEPGSLLNNLTAESGALINTVSGNLNVLDTLTLNSNGIVAPGASPGTYNVGTFNSNNGNNPMSIRFGQADPLPGLGEDYSQINVREDFNGTLWVKLERYESDQSTPLGNIAAIELVRIGGEENGTIRLAERFVQNGRELLLDRRIREADSTAMVAGDPPGGITEDLYFDAGAPSGTSLVAYGLKTIVQDETYGLATLTGTVHQAGRDTLGTFVERRGTGELESSWMRAGANHTEVNDTVSNVQDIAFGQFGVDLLEMGALRGGVLGSYTASTSGIETETGTAGLQGNAWSGGVYATWANGDVYVDAVGQYGYSDWTFSPTSASDLTISGHTALAALEAGLRIGNDHASITPWSQMVWQSTFYDGMNSDWVDSAEFVNKDSLHVRGGLRAEGRLGAFAPNLDLSLSHDVNDRKTVTVDGFDFATGMGGTRVELGAGFEADVSDTMTIWSQVKGAYGVGESDVIGYQGRAGMRASW